MQLRFVSGFVQNFLLERDLIHDTSGHSQGHGESEQGTLVKLFDRFRPRISYSLLRLRDKESQVVVNQSKPAVTRSASARSGTVGTAQCYS